MVELKRIVLDYFKFIKIILVNDISLVQTTTAFYPYSVVRDGLFIIIAKLWRRKVIVFFRGWDDNFVNNLSGLYLKMFQTIFFRADAIIDLVERNISYFKKNGYNNKLFLETTLVDFELVSNFDIVKQINSRIINKYKTILFVSRIEKTKGVFKILEIYTLLKKENPEFKLIFAGDGAELDNLKNLVREQKIKDVEIKGFVERDEKKQLFEEASIFLFLSDFEGMPNAVLEAMAFGLPVITTNVGGIASVFKDKLNGVLIENYNPIYISSEIKRIISDVDLYNSISQNNYLYAKNKFWSNIVAQRVQHIFNQVIKEY
ncbi:MAG: glycosyltransferase family 4 protein [Melioribacteraceae bacterium]|nr:glycosyltransferase family 4 protein [Melioribacteraceae bacterium]